MRKTFADSAHGMQEPTTLWFSQQHAIKNGCSLARVTNADGSTQLVFFNCQEPTYGSKYSPRWQDKQCVWQGPKNQITWLRRVEPDELALQTRIKRSPISRSTGSKIMLAK